MSSGELVLGVIGLDLALLALGFCLLSPFLKGLGPRVAASYAGVALLAGAAAAGVTLSAIAVAGLPTGPPAFGVAAGALAALGLLAGRLAARRDVPLAIRPAGPTAAAPLLLDLVAAGAALLVAAICAFALVGGFRSSPWLDDAWSFWLPKGLTLAQGGVDARLWAPSPGYVQFTNPDYPLWWSILAALATKFTGAVDLRAVNGQLAIFAVAFVAAAARLLWGLVRPWLLWPSLLLVVAAPEFFRQAQGGGADIPLAAYLALFVVCGALWLVRREPYTLVLAFLFGAAAASIKNEGVPQLLLFAAIVGIAGLQAGLRLVGLLWGAAVASILASAPWLVWRIAHDVPSEFALARLSPANLLDRTERVQPTVDALRTHLLSPREWLASVVLMAVLAVAAVALTRRPLFLLPPILVGAGFLFWVYVYWADTLDLQYRLRDSSYRVVDGLVLVACVSVPVLAEHVVGRRGAPATGPQSR